jgi:hypothetical protein
MQRSARSLSVVVVALATIAGGDAGALAAPPWSEPQSINGRFERILFNTNGQGMLIGLDQVLPGDGRRGVRAATIQGGTPGQTRESTTSLDLGVMKAYGRDGVVAGGHVLVKRGVSPHVALTRGRIGHRLGRPQPLRGRSRSSYLLDLAVDGVGNAVAVVRWCRTERCGRQTLAVFRWRPGARLSKPVRIARGRRLGAGVAINRRGDVAIVWDRFNRRGRRDVFGQILTASGKLRPRQRVGVAPAGPRYRIALTDDRRVVAAWIAQQVNECHAHPGEIAVAQAGKGGRFGRARRLTTLAITGCGRYASDPAVQFARAPDGRVLIAWSGNEGARWVVRAGDLGAAGVKGATVVSDRARDAVLADLALGSRGEAVLLLAEGVGGSDLTGPNRLLAVTRGWNRGGFTAPELVADQTGIGSSVTFDPLTSRATVAYPSQDAHFMPITSVVTRDWFGP